MGFGTRKILSGLAWSGVGLYTIRLLGLVTTLVLAKVLVPADFGLVAIASMLVAILQLLKDMGLSEAIIYQQDRSERVLDTAHTLLVGLYFLLFLIAAALAPVVAHFYKTPDATPVIIITASTLVWDSARAVPRAVFRRELAFRSLFLPEVVPVGVACVVSLIMALHGYGVWALVAKTVLHSILGMVLLGFSTPYRPKFRYDGAVARQLLQYGKFIMGATILFVAVYNIDKFYVSRFAGLAALGMYELAVRISDLPVREFSFVVGSVMFPVLAKAQAGPILRRTFLGALKYTAFVSFPMALGISFYGPRLVANIYGPAWTGMIAPLQVLSVYALFRSLSSIIHDGFKATGNPRLMQKAVFFKLCLIGALGIPAIKMFGLVGICVVIVVTYAATFVVELVVISRLLGVPFSMSARTLVVPFAGSVSVVVLVNRAIIAMWGNPTTVELLAGIALTVPLYALFIFTFDKGTVGELRKILAGRAAVEQAGPASA